MRRLHSDAMNAWPRIPKPMLKAEAVDFFLWQAYMAEVLNALDKQKQKIYIVSVDQSEV